jgi:hypothetical protein
MVLVDGKWMQEAFFIVVNVVNPPYLAILNFFKHLQITPELP